MEWSGGDQQGSGVDQEGKRRCCGPVTVQPCAHAAEDRVREGRQTPECCGAVREVTGVLEGGDWSRQWMQV